MAFDGLPCGASDAGANADWTGDGHDVRRALIKGHFDVPYQLSGDVGVGEYQPEDRRAPTFPRIPAERLSAVSHVGNLSSMVSDILDELGWRLSLPATTVIPRHGGAAPVIGHALTLRYLPERKHLLDPEHFDAGTKMAHLLVLQTAQPGDVVVIDATGCGPISSFGSLAATAAVRAGVSAVIVDGGIRDLGAIRQLPLSVWSTYVTPVTGKHRLEAASINGCIQCGGIQVVPGDVVIADEVGICFIPADTFDHVVDRILEVEHQEMKLAREMLR